ncbi:MAG TPA: signal peptidase I [Actinomycetota bacterium]
MAERPPDTAPLEDETPSEPPEPSDEPAVAPQARSTWRELSLLLIVAVVLAVLIKSFLVQAFFIPSPSMEPTLRPGDRILVCRVCLHLQDIHRGDVLVFSDPHPTGSGRGVAGGFLHWLGQGIGVAQPENPDYVKRVAALPGETWEIRHGVLYVNGEEIDRPYLSPNVDTRSFGPETVPDGMLFMLGDNPLDSGDSRFPPNEEGLGYVPIDTVIGKAFVRVWPPSRIGSIR